MYIYRLCNSTTLMDSIPRAPNSPIERCARFQKREPRRTKTKSTCIVKEVPSLLSKRRCCSGMSKGTQPSADIAAMLSVKEGAPRLYEPACELGAGVGLQEVQRKVQRAQPRARRTLEPMCMCPCARARAYARKRHAMYACACVRSPEAVPEAAPPLGRAPAQRHAARSARRLARRA